MQHAEQGRIALFAFLDARVASLNAKVRVWVGRDGWTGNEWMSVRSVGGWVRASERASREGRSDTRRITHVAAMMAVRWVSERSHVLQLVVAWVHGGVSGMMSALHMCVCVCVCAWIAEAGWLDCVDVGSIERS